MRRPSLLAAVLAAVVLSASACSDGTVGADGEVTVSGRFEGPDGRALAGADVVLLNPRASDDGPPSVELTAGTLAMACLAPGPPAECEAAARTRTDADGAFRFELTGRDVQGPDGNPAIVHLAAAAPGGGPAVGARFQVARRSLTVPTLGLWAPDLELTTGRTVRGEWTARETGSIERLVFFAGAGQGRAGSIVWIADGRPTLSVDPRVLEDSVGTAAVESLGSAEGDGTTFRLTYRSRPVAYTGQGGTPASRLLECTPEPCAVTDGDLTAPAQGESAGGGEVSVDLGSSMTPTLVVVRGCPATCDVQTSVDGLTFRTVGSAATPFALVTPVLSAPVRYVKVASTTDLGALAEVSVWLT
ncbi:MAG: hypothetical protein AB1673_16445 [Actinomycetota bacterium]